MLLSISATRMELLRLKKRLMLARRGHRLLKDKQDELMRIFLSLVEETKKLYTVVEEGLEEAYISFLNARSIMERQFLEEALLASQMKVDLTVSSTPLLNLRVPAYEVKIEGDFFCYGTVDVSTELDNALGKYKELIPSLVELAEREKTLEMVSYEIERTRRRVNALEHILIPSIMETIKYIEMKLEEIERGNLTRLMKIKDIVRGRK